MRLTTSNYGNEYAVIMFLCYFVANESNLPRHTMYYDFKRLLTNPEHLEFYIL